MLPEKFEVKIRGMLKDEADTFFKTYEEVPMAGLRINRLKLNAEDFLGMSPYAVKSIPWTNNGFYYENDNKPAKHPYYFAGLYYLQEPSAMAPASILPINEHDRVLDMCAAPGGKSTELGAKLGGTGVLVSNDISPSRAKALLKNIEIFGIGNTVITTEAPYNLASKLEGFFDKILVDAPCSGEGMFRKDKAIMKNYEQYGVEYYSKIQREIILYAADMLKPGGMMVYSTCTFSSEEDEGTIGYLLANRPEIEVADIDCEYFCDANPDYIDESFLLENGIELSKERFESIRKAKRLWPHKLMGEGHFVALLRKREDAVAYTKSFSNNKRVNKLPSELEDFLKLIDRKFDKDRFFISGEKVYYLPEHIVNTEGLRTMRNGLLMGEIKKNRFEPSQALACNLKMSEYANCVSLKADDINVIKYLKGETVMLEDFENADVSKLKDGNCLVCVEGYPLGFAKYQKGTFKNKYLPGWRWM